MDSKLLGQRIKEARLAKKMTQSEVVGSFITRNMLSQIESGNAVPSMKTLTYLAKVLELPPALLLQEECADSEETAEASHDAPMLSCALSADSFEVSSEPLTFLHAKEAYLAGEDANAYSLLKSIPENSPLADESAALLTRVTLRLAAASCASPDLEA
ncbi:MAG: helix-turn-helix domain-containing protein, partial [Lachnospiraceae bacterium]